MDPYQYVKLPDGSYGKFNADAGDDVIRGAILKDFPDAYSGSSVSPIPPPGVQRPDPGMHEFNLDKDVPPVTPGSMLKAAPGVLGRMAKPIYHTTPFGVGASMLQKWAPNVAQHIPSALTGAPLYKLGGEAASTLIPLIAGGAEEGVPERPPSAVAAPESGLPRSASRSAVRAPIGAATGAGGSGPGLAQDLLKFLSPATATRLNTGARILKRAAGWLGVPTTNDPVISEAEANANLDRTNWTGGGVQPVVNPAHPQTMGTQPGSTAEILQRGRVQPVQTPKPPRVPLWKQAEQQGAGLVDDAAGAAKPEKEERPVVANPMNVSGKMKRRDLLEDMEIKQKMEGSVTKKNRKNDPGSIKPSLDEGVGLPAVSGASGKETGGLVDVYHGTTVAKGQKIAKEGLKRNPEADPSFGPFVARKEELAEPWAQVATRPGDPAWQGQGEQGAIIKARIPKSYLHADDLLNPKGDDYAEFNLKGRTIPPKSIDVKGSRVLQKRGIAEARDDQGVKQDLEQRLRNKHTQPWGSVAQVLEKEPKPSMPETKSLIKRYGKGEQFVAPDGQAWGGADHYRIVDNYAGKQKSVSAATKKFFDDTKSVRVYHGDEGDSIALEIHHKPTEEQLTTLSRILSTKKNPGGRPWVEWEIPGTYGKGSMGEFRRAVEKADWSKDFDLGDRMEERYASAPKSAPKTLKKKGK